MFCVPFFVAFFLSIIPLISISYLPLINYFMPLLANLFPSTLICVIFYLLVSVETAPHQISRENCKNLSYCNHRGLCELRYTQNDTSKFEYFCSCHGGDWIGDDCSIGKNNSRIVNKRQIETKIRCMEISALFANKNTNFY